MGTQNADVSFQTCTHVFFPCRISPEMKIQMCFQTCTHVFFPCRIPPASLTRGNLDLIKAAPQCFIISLKAAGLLNNKVSAPECTWHPAAVIKHLLSEWKWNAVITYNWGSDLVWTVQGHFPKKRHMSQTQGRKLPRGETKTKAASQVPSPSRWEPWAGRPTHVLSRKSGGNVV